MKSITSVIYVLVMVATVVAIDIFIFRHYFWERLMSNIGVVLVYIAFYLRFMKH